MNENITSHKVYLRIPITKEHAESYSIQIQDVCNSSLKWSDESIEKLKQVLPKIKTENGTFIVNYDFTELSKTLNLDKRIIFNKVIELYHSEDLKKQETSHTKHARLNDQAESSLTNTPNVLALQPKSESTLTNNSSSLKQSLLDKLELLKLGGTQSSNSNSNSSVDKSIKKTKPPFTTSLHPPPGITHTHFNIIDGDSKLNIDNHGHNHSNSYDSDDSSSSSSSPSVINMATASTYLHRSRLMGNQNSYSMDHDKTDEEENNEDYLLTGTSTSLPNSLLGEEALKML